MECILAISQFNGFSFSVYGTEQHLRALKDLLIPNTMVKSMTLYQITEGVPTKLEGFNYTTLKELRKNANR
jgi:hypothetical protein